MTKFLLLIVCFCAGAILRRTPYFDERSPTVLNNLLIYFFIPVLSLYHVPKINFELKQIWLSITPFIVYLSSFIFIKIASYFGKMERPTEGVLIMCSGIGSISFVGFPIFELLYGAEGLAYGIILSLAGTLVVFNTVGISTGLYYANSERQSIFFFIKKMIRFPPFVAFVIASLCSFFQIQYPVLLDATLKSLTAPFSVLALLAIGMQMEITFDKKLLKNLFIGQFHKLIIAPLVIYILMWHILGIDGLVGKICVLGAAIGSMNAISIVAAQMGLHPKLAILMPAISIPLSIPWLFFIGMFLN